MGADLKVHPLGLEGARWIGVAGGQAALLRSTDGSSVVVHDGGRVVRPLAPPDCLGPVGGSGHLAYSCPPVAGDTQHRRLAVTRLDGSHATDVTVPAFIGADGSSPDLTGVGGQWISQFTNGYHYSTASYVNWHTGKQVSGRSDNDRHAYVNLDAPGLFSHLCAPLKRALEPSDTYELNDPLAPLTVRSPWALVLSGGRFGLQRCGQRRPARRYPAWLGALAFDRRRVAWTTSTIAAGQRVLVHVARLDGEHRVRTLRLRFSSEARNPHLAMAFTRHRLYLIEADETGNDRIRYVRVR
jgi:hypothetical protein